MASGATRKRLGNELKDMTTHPLGFFKVSLADSNIFEWDVWMKGPTDSDYEGGVFRMKLSFSENYPFEPPKLVFVDEFWHPNVYPDGKVCISILHPPEVDPLNPQEDIGERWRPIHTPQSILLSVLSMLCDPNFSSPANVDASVEWRRDKETYRERVKGLIRKALANLPEGFEIPAAVIPPKPEPEFDLMNDGAFDGDFDVVMEDDPDDLLDSDGDELLGEDFDSDDIDDVDLDSDDLEGLDIDTPSLDGLSTAELEALAAEDDS